MLYIVRRFIFFLKKKLEALICENILNCIVEMHQFHKVNDEFTLLFFL